MRLSGFRALFVRACEAEAREIRAGNPAARRIGIHESNHLVGDPDHLERLAARLKAESRKSSRPPQQQRNSV